MDRWLVMLGAAVLGVGCGDQVADTSEEVPPIASIQGQFEGELDSPSIEPGRIRAALMWTRLPGFEECLAALPQYPDTPEGQMAEANADWESRCKYLSVDQFAIEEKQQTVDVSAELPAAFTLPIFDLPSPGSLYGSAGAYLGVANLVVFEDGNGNRVLDLIDRYATASFDTIAGRSEVLLVYREGALSPVWRYFKTWGCQQEPAQGFSLLRMGTDACEWLSADAVVSVRYDASWLQTVCLDDQPMSAHFLKPAPSTLPAGQLVACTAGGRRALFNEHPTAFCSAANTYAYSLSDYDFISEQSWCQCDDIPTWWPCVLEADACSC